MKCCCVINKLLQQILIIVGCHAFNECANGLFNSSTSCKMFLYGIKRWHFSKKEVQKTAENYQKLRFIVFYCLSIVLFTIVSYLQQCSGSTYSQLHIQDHHRWHRGLFKIYIRGLIALCIFIIFGPSPTYSANRKIMLFY